MRICNAASAEFFHTPAGAGFVDLLINGHRETWPIRSQRFRTWLRRHHYEETRTALSPAEIRSTLDLLEAHAQFDGPERAVHARLAEHEGCIYLDLADESWRAVEIGPQGWRIIVLPPVRFRRASGMLPLTEPQAGGSIETLASFLNLPSRSDFVLVVAWLLSTLRASGPYPVLAISGEQGSAKTVLSKLLKALIDPNVAPVRAVDAVSLGLRKLPTIHLQYLPRMADFALWATACETAFWPAGTFARAYQANRRAAVEDLIEADPVAARVRAIMANRRMWTGSASDLLCAGADSPADGLSNADPGWPKNPRALAGRLRRAQTFLRTMGIDIDFRREGRAGNRVIRICTTEENTVCTVSNVSSTESNSGQAPPSFDWRPTDMLNADDADGADANAGTRFA